MRSNPKRWHMIVDLLAEDLRSSQELFKDEPMDEGAAQPSTSLDCARFAGEKATSQSDSQIVAELVYIALEVCMLSGLHFSLGYAAVDDLNTIFREVGVRNQ
eukprot:5702333-Amphidinium_carterae.1